MKSYQVLLPHNARILSLHRASNIRQSRLLLPCNLANALHFLKLHDATHMKARSRCGVRQEKYVQLAGRQVPCSFETTEWILLITEIESLHLVTPMLSL